MGENFSPYGPYRFIYGPYKISPTTQEVPQQKGDNSPRQGQVYGPYRILYGPYKLFRKPRLELETETAGEAEKEGFQEAISGIKEDIPDLRGYHSFILGAWETRNNLEKKKKKFYNGSSDFILFFYELFHNFYCAFF